MLSFYCMPVCLIIGPLWWNLWVGLYRSLAFRTSWHHSSRSPTHPVSDEKKILWLFIINKAFFWNNCIFSGVIVSFAGFLYLVLLWLYTSVNACILLGLYSLATLIARCRGFLYSSFGGWKVSSFPSSLYCKFHLISEILVLPKFSSPHSCFTFNHAKFYEHIHTFLNI